jgi:hypothetical protein
VRFNICPELVINDAFGQPVGFLETLAVIPADLMDGARGRQPLMLFWQRFGSLDWQQPTVSQPPLVRLLKALFLLFWQI